MLKKYNLIFFFILVIFYPNQSFSELLIKYKVNGEIITNIDIQNQKKYLLFLRPNLKNLPDDEISKLSENSLIREIIKKKELNKIIENIETTKFVEEVKLNLFAFAKAKNEQEFVKILKKNNIEYKILIEKLKYEGLWNEFIYKKFNSFVKINENNLKEKIISNVSKIKKFEYNLSEILFELDQNESINSKYNKIIKDSKINEFKNAATKYSISDSAYNGGEIGWVKETLLSEKLSDVLRDIEIGQITKPIKYPNGFLILKVNDKREMKKKINIDDELREAIKFEKNRQLNQFSLLFYKKLKKNSSIDEF